MSERARKLFGSCATSGGPKPMSKDAMTLLSNDHYEIMKMFDRLFKSRRLDKEDKAMWPRGIIYQDGEVNNLFLAFRHGVAYGRDARPQ